MDFLSKLLEKTAAGFVITPKTAAAVKSIDYDLRLKKDMIINVLLAGIPLMIIVAADDAQISTLLFEESKKNTLSRTQHTEFAVKDFLAIFGDKARPMSQAISAETGVNFGDVYKVLGLFLPTFVDAIEEEDPRDDKALAEIFRADADEL